MNRRRPRFGRRSVLPHGPAVRAARRQMRAQRRLLHLAGKIDFHVGFDPEDGDDEDLDWDVEPTASAR